MSLSQKDRLDIKSAIRAGNLRVKSADPETGETRLSKISDVMRHTTPHKNIVRVETTKGRVVECTEDHSLFVADPEGQGFQPIEAGKLKPGAMTVVDGLSGLSDPEEVRSVIFLSPQRYTYDLSVPGHQNFFLANGLLAHNSYSIGGISLDIEKSSKYEGIKNNAEQQLDKLLEAKTRTVKIIRGLSQSRYSIGVRSAFGPITGAGILTPRKFLGI